MAFISFIALIGVALLGGVMFVKRSDQDTRDRLRRKYMLSFPSGMSTDQVKAWIQAISGTLRSSRFNFVGAPTLVFEVIASDRGISHRLMVPWQHADYVVGQLRTMVPGIHVTPLDELNHPEWRYVVEVGESNPNRSLRIQSAEILSASLLSSVQALKPGEAVLMQWVISPTNPSSPPPPDKTHSHWFVDAMFGVSASTKQKYTELTEKLSEPNLLAVLRLAAKAETTPRAMHLVQNVKRVLESIRGPHNRFQPTVSLHKNVQRRIADASGMVLYPAQLSSSELVGLLAWPLGSPHVAGLPAGRARHLPATEAVPRVGKVIGTSNFPGHERPLAIHPNESVKHLHIVGPTGVGKTTLLSNLVVQDLQAGHGVALIDPKGDLFHDVLDKIPKDRMADVIVLDVNDTGWPVGFNVLADGSPERAVSEIVKLFESLYPEMKRGVWARAGFFRGLTTLAQWPGAAFPDIVPLLSPSSASDPESVWRDTLIRSVTDPELKKFWQRYTNEPPAKQDSYAAPVIERAWQLNERPMLRNIVGQSKSTFNMRDVALGKKVLLVNLHGDVDAEAAQLLGTMLVNSLWNAAQSTGKKDNPTFLYLDEFQSFLKLPVSTEEILAKARSLGLGMVLAHQHLGQLTPDVRTAVLANARSKVVFQTSADDARDFAREFGPQVEVSELTLLGQYEFIGRFSTGAGVSGPVTGTTNPPLPRTGSSLAVKELSRQQFARSKAEVEQEIRNRRRVPEAKKKRPKLGETDW